MRKDRQGGSKEESEEEEPSKEEDHSKEESSDEEEGEDMSSELKKETDSAKKRRLNRKLAAAAAAASRWPSAGSKSEIARSFGPGDITSGGRGADRSSPRQGQAVWHPSCSGRHQASRTQS